MQGSDRVPLVIRVFFFSWYGCAGLQILACLIVLSFGIAAVLGIDTFGFKITPVAGLVIMAVSLAWIFFAGCLALLGRHFFQSFLSHTELYKEKSDNDEFEVLYSGADYQAADRRPDTEAAGARPPARNPSRLFWGAFGAVISLMLALFGTAFWLTTDIRATAHEFISELESNNYERAFQLCTPELQRSAGDPRNLEKLALEGEFYEPLFWTSTGFSGGTAYLKSDSVSLRFQKIDGAWRVASFYWPSFSSGGFRLSETSNDQEIIVSNDQKPIVSEDQNPIVSNDQKPIVPPAPPGKPDLQVTRVFLNDAGFMRAQVANSGEAPAKRVRVGFFVDGKRKSTYGNVTIDPHKENLATSGRIPPGKHTIRVVVDPENMIAESDESNNSNEVTLVNDAVPAEISTTTGREVTPSGQPDLRVMRVFLNAAGFMRAQVRNAGAAPAKDILVSFYVDGERVSTYGTFTFGAQKQRRASAQKLSPGSHVVRVVIDPDNTVAESDESNNSNEVTLESNAAPAEIPTTASREATPSGQPDLRVMRVFLNDAGFMRARVRNAGTVPAKEIIVSFFVDGELVSIYRASTLGARKRRQASAQKLSPGSHVVRVVVDPDNTIAESDESNNVMEVTLSSPP